MFCIRSNSVIKVTVNTHSTMFREVFYPQQLSCDHHRLCVLYLRKIWIKCECMVNEAIKTTWDVPDSLCPPVTHTLNRRKQNIHTWQNGKILSIWKSFLWYDTFFLLVREQFLCARVKREPKFNHQVLSPGLCFVVTQVKEDTCISSNKFQSYQISLFFRTIKVKYETWLI